jgi:hypothetical protein
MGQDSMDLGEQVRGLQVDPSSERCRKATATRPGYSQLAMDIASESAATSSTWDQSLDLVCKSVRVVLRAFD